MINIKAACATLLSFTLTSVFSFASYAKDWQPKAATLATIVTGKVRFTILTSQLIRLEYSLKEKTNINLKKSHT